MEGAVGTTDGVLADPDNRMFSSEDPQLLSRRSLTYIALIAKVILSSPSKKLNLASIYSAMEERFPYLRARGPGWKNSVRHNLSVNDCFVKVDRCEDGRGHYWGVHQAHLKEFQQGNFRHYRRIRDRRERYPGNTGRDLVWMKRTTRTPAESFLDTAVLSASVGQCVLDAVPRLDEPIRESAGIILQHCRWKSALKSTRDLRAALLGC
ncbi:Forkhead box protein D4 [Takifugu flavidus]|uniref:Forkhead box protein D4 n=1 Tax=Takifugu flavidus TaxID=433684 RepID=A0A5C6PC32_9TELE|nr:Forkhead box protein D4 [Takifugu flavidus]